MIQTASRQSATLIRSTARELLWGLRGVSREVDRWRGWAQTIPDRELRTDALQALGRKRGNINGAALFWTLPDRRSDDLLRVLVAYEILADYLDCVSERGAACGIANGRQLHLAMVEALDPNAACSDYYRYHSSSEDGGYLRGLVTSCQDACERLPSYQPVRPLLLRAANLALILGLNHELDPVRRDTALQGWAAHELPNTTGQTWFERTGGASAWLTVLAMLALAAKPTQTVREASDTYAAYLHWIAPAGAMLDSYSDIAEDAENGDHSYIAHYPSMEIAVQRVGELVRHARREARTLPVGERHSLLAACMIAFYLSKDTTSTPELRPSTRELSRAGGPLVTLLLPVMRTWRAAYGQRSA